jgi:hypothetical protein
VSEIAQDEEVEACAIQCAINSLSAWRMEGSQGRAMMEAIEAGWCMLGLEPTRDYWGNRIPSRTEVKEGTKGSRQYVVDRMGDDWALMLEACDGDS